MDLQGLWSVVIQNVNESTLVEAGIIRAQIPSGQVLCQCGILRTRSSYNPAPIVSLRVSPSDRNASSHNLANNFFDFLQQGSLQQWYVVPSGLTGAEENCWPSKWAILSPKEGFICLGPFYMFNILIPSGLFIHDQ